MSGAKRQRLRSRAEISKDIYEAWKRKPRPSYKQLAREFDCHPDTVRRCLGDYRDAAESRLLPPMLTDSEYAYVEGLSKGKSRYESAVAAGIKGPKKINEFIEVTENNAITRRFVADALSKIKGGDPEAVAANIVRLMTAKKEVVYAGGIKRVADNTTQIKATQLAANIHMNHEDREIEERNKKNNIPTASGFIVLTEEQAERFKRIRGDGYLPGVKIVNDEVIDTVAEEALEREPEIEDGGVSSPEEHPLAVRGIRLMDAKKGAPSEGVSEDDEAEGGPPVESDPDAGSSVPLEPSNT
jgi:hypothetical protein